MRPIEVRLLGKFSVRRTDGSAVDPDEWRTTKTIDLLRLLALDAGRPVPTYVIIDRLWPRVDAERGRASLRTAASQLRKVLRADCLERTPGGMALVGAWVDVQRLEALFAEVEGARRGAEPGDVVALTYQAEAVYAGDIETCDSSGDWLLEVRAHYRARRCRMLLDAAAAAASLTWLRDSLELAQRAATLDDGEEVARALMRGYAGLGEMSKALEVYERVRAELADRLGVDPSPQTRALHLQLLKGTEPTGVAGGLVGHREAVAALRTAISRLLANQEGGVIWLHGPVGSGRDTVVEVACARLDASLHNIGDAPVWLRSPHPWDVPDVDVVVMPEAGTVSEHAIGVLRSLAKATRRVYVVPVADAPPQDGPGVVVPVPALSDDDMTELAGVLLQGRPTVRLVERLAGESQRLAGTAVRVARRWLSEGRVVWTPEGLDVTDTTDVPGWVPAQAVRRSTRRGLASPA